MILVEGYRGSEDEQMGRPMSREELVREHREPGIKRAKRLLNPLDDHPYLSTVDVSPMLQSRVIKGSSSVAFSKAMGLGDARALLRAEDKHPGNAEMVSESLAQDGYQLLGEIVVRPTPEPVTQPANSVYLPDTSGGRIIPGFFHGSQVYTPIARLEQFGDVRQAFGLLNQVIRKELFQDDEYSPDQQKGLFAAAVGLAQTVAVERSKEFIRGKSSGDIDPINKSQIGRKHFVRDHVLTAAFRVLREEKQPGLADYFIAQKMHEAEQRYKKTKGK